MEIIHVVMILLLVVLGFVMDKRWHLTKRYVSPALAGGLVGVIVSGVFYLGWGKVWQPPEVLGHLFVTAFLFSIGVKMGVVYTQKHGRHLIYLFLFATFTILLLESLANSMFTGDSVLFFIFGSDTIAWNGEWVERLQGLYQQASPFILHFHLSLFFVFLFSPLVLRLMRRTVKMKEIDTQFVSVKHWHLPSVLVTVGVTAIALGLKHVWFQDVLFLFDFVLTMAIGFMIGWRLRKRDHQPFMRTVQDLGTISLYSFIVTMMLLSAHIMWTLWDWSVFAWMLVKFMIITLIYIGIALMWIKNHRQLVLVSACWAFTLSAPVTCMNTMRSVVNRHGEADDILLLVPPVILWLINYSHYAIVTWMYG